MTLDTRYVIRDTGCEIRDKRYGMLDTGYEIPYTGCRIPVDTRYVIRVKSGQIMEDLVPINFPEENVLFGKDLIPISRRDGGDLIGNARYEIRESLCQTVDARYHISL